MDALACQEKPEARRSQKQPGAARSSQEQPEAVRSSHKLPGAARRKQFNNLKLGADGKISKEN